MSYKYHYNTDTNRMNRCNAGVKPCPLGDNTVHVSATTATLAKVEYEKLASQVNQTFDNATVSMSKVVDTKVEDDMLLIYVDTINNNNKFYKASYNSSNSTATITYGRVGTAGKTIYKHNMNLYAYKKLINSKINKGYSKQEISIDIPTSTNNNNKNVVSSLIGSQDPQLQKSIDLLLEANRHDLVDGTNFNIQVSDSGLIKTPLGAVTLSTVKKAEHIFEQIENNFQNNPNWEKHHILVSQYLRLIPHTFDARHKSPLGTSLEIEQEKEYLDRLKKSVEAYEMRKLAEEQAQSGDTSGYNNIFNVKLTTVTDPAIIKNVKDFYSSTLDKRHYSSQKKIKNIFAIEHSADKDKEFTELAKEKGNVERLWHGTDAGNVLSILRKGFFVPDRNQKNINITGRMFGDGVYLSDISTKSLNYSTGFWSRGSTRSKGNNSSFMFLTETVMGKKYEPRNAPSSEIPSRARQYGYDSINIKAGTNGVLNNEMIVWNTNQIKIAYLVEVE